MAAAGEQRQPGASTRTSVTLIGDSIRLHYQPLVAERLAGLARVSGPLDNCRSSAVILDNLDAWAIAAQPQIIHLNCGAHDIRHDGDADQPLVPLSAYAANLEAIFQRLRRETAATLVWATITPINEAHHQAMRDSRRYAADVTAYNAVALAIAGRHGAIIDDLPGAVRAAGPDRLLKPDGLHFTATGSAFLAERVADCLMPLLR